MAYIDIPFEETPGELSADAYNFLAAVFAGWVAAQGSLAAAMVEATSRMASEVRTVAAQVPPAIYEDFGATVVGISKQPSTNASVDVTLTLTAAALANLIVPAGTLTIGWRDASGTLHPFSSRADVVFLTGATTATTTLFALEEGTAANGFSGPGEPVESPVALASAVTTSPSSGGQDEETSDEYRAGLSGRLRVLAIHPIIPDDWAIMARDITGVDRALAVDLYDPVANTFAHPRTVSVFPIGLDGSNVSGQAKADLQAYFDAHREINFTTIIADPVRTTIDVQATVVSEPGFDPVDVKARAEAALAAYLSPANWGRPDTGEREWRSKPIVRYLDLAGVLKGVDGVDVISTLQSRVGGGTFASVDITMNSGRPHALPTVGSITVTAT